MTEKEILEIIKKYYPFGIESSDEAYSETQEFKRLDTFLKLAEKAQTKWFEYEAWLTENLKDCDVQAKTFTHLFNYDPCFRTCIYLPRQDGIHSHLIVHLGLLTNHYTIYATQNKTRTDFITVFNPYDKNEIPFEDKTFAGYPDHPKTNFYPDSPNQLSDTLKEKTLEVIDIAVTEMLKRYPNREQFPKELINKVVDNVSRPNTLLNCTTYFNLLFTDHMF
jgi:hypothetical protein